MSLYLDLNFHVYFEGEELDRLLNLKMVGAEKVEDARHSIAVKLLEWLRQTTFDKILHDTRMTPEQHYERGMTDAGPKRGYLHKPEYVKLSIHRAKEAEPATAFLTPAKGYSIIKDGYEDVYFPSYYVEVANR